MCEECGDQCVAVDETRGKSGTNEGAALSPNEPRDPLHPQDPSGYVYVKPADWQKDAEKNIETMEDRAAVEKLFRGRQVGK